MSKKIMKRSLALGALMAFVITGQALAASTELTSNPNVTASGTYIGDFILGDNVVELKTDDKLIVLGTYDSSQQTTVYVAEGQTLRLVNDYSDSTSYNQGVLQNTTITGNGIIELIRNGKYGAIGHYDGNQKNKVHITADKIIAKAPADVIYLNNGGQEDVKLNAREIYLESNWPVYACGNAHLEIKASEKLEINGLNGGAIIANDGSNIIIGSLDANKKADIIIKGNVVSLDASDSIVGAGIVDIALETEKSSITGVFESWSDNKETEVRTLELSNGATWNVTGVSDVTNLKGNGGNIVVEEVVENLVTVKNATVENLTVSTTTEDGNTDTTLSALSRVIQTKNGGVVADKVQLKNAIYDNVTATVNGLGDVSVDEGSKQVAEANLSVNDMAAIGLMSWRAEMNDMNKRMGELRNANGEHGVWVRMVRGESEYNSVKNQYNQYQLGYDEKLSVDKRWTVGVALSYTDAENNFAQGSGESTNKALSIYGSKLNDDGTFVDLIAKYARLENDFETFSGMGAADYDANGYSFSAEFGKRIQQGKGLWIEPQVELTYGKVGSVDYVTKNKVNVAQDGMESLVGRIGFSLGKDIEKGNVYARASYLYDFDGETKATLNNDAVLENDLGGGWWEVGVGANINLSKATYIYADVEKTFGGEVDTNWQWNLGVRYSF